MRKYTISVMMVLAVSNIISAEIIRGIDIDFVTIGNAGNAADSTGFGAVDYNYHIGKYEITIAQWNSFVLAAGLPVGNPDYGYDQNAVFTNDQQPTNNVSWLEAAQFCNYLTSGDKIHGAYLFTNGDFTGIDRDSAISVYGTIYVIPTEDEWYKAAYYTGNGYSIYANGTDIAPLAGIDANYNQDDPYSDGSWAVGTGTIEQNNTFDMMGNVWEWNEEELGVPDRRARGGAYTDDGYDLKSSTGDKGLPIYHEEIITGFRVVSIPELIPPIANINSPYIVYVGDMLTLDGNGSTDPDGDIVSCLWDLDDDGVFETDAGAQMVFDVNYSYLESLGLLINHTYTIHLKVIDNDGLSGIAGVTLIIIPKPAAKVAVDIKPGSCPNPVNTKSSGVLPVAILGSNDLDVTMIDLASIRLAGVGPLRSAYEDIAAPAPDIVDCNCIETGPDGLLDITLKFATQAIIEAVGDVDDGDIVTLELTGILYDPIPHEIPIEGSDCILIKGKYRIHNKADINKDDIVNGFDFFIMASEWLEDRTL